MFRGKGCEYKTEKLNKGLLHMGDKKAHLPLEGLLIEEFDMRGSL